MINQKNESLINQKKIIQTFIDQISTQLINYIHCDFNFRRIKLKKAFIATALKLNTTTAYVKKILNKFKLNSSNKEFSPKLILKNLYETYNKNPKTFNYSDFIENWSVAVTKITTPTNNDLFVVDNDQNPTQIEIQSYSETNQQNNIAFVTGFLANSDNIITVPEDIKPLEFQSSSDYFKSIINQPKTKTTENLAYNIWELAKKYNIELPSQLSWDIAELKLNG